MLPPVHHVMTQVVELGKTRDGGGCKIILIGDSSGGNLVLSLSRWIRDEGNLPAPDGLLLLSVSVFSFYMYFVHLFEQLLFIQYSPRVIPVSEAFFLRSCNTNMLFFLF
jgi:alpha/beta hydrolase fold